jgi:hypothetical protein
MCNGEFVPVSSSLSTIVLSGKKAKPCGTELAMIFSFHVGLTDSVMQRIQFFSCQCLFDIFLPPHCQIYYFNIRKKLNDLLSV